MELGCGPGRDARALAGHGVSVRGVDHSATAIDRARRQPGNPAEVEFVEADLFDALAGSPDGSLDAIYAHVVYLVLADDEIDRLVTEVRRTLRSGGLHLFALRSTSDPIAGQGVELAPDVWARAPLHEPIRYYRRESLDRFTGSGLVRQAAEENTGAAIWYVCDRRT